MLSIALRLNDFHTPKQDLKDEVSDAALALTTVNQENYAVIQAGDVTTSNISYDKKESITG